MNLEKFNEWRKSIDGFIETGFRHSRLMIDESYHDDEREFVAQFNNENRRSDYELSVLIHGSRDNNISTCQPEKWLTDHEKKIILTTIQWLGTPVGKDFLNKCGFTKTRQDVE